MTEKEKFIRWFNNEKKHNGLIDIKLVVNPNYMWHPSEDEELFKEINSIIEAKDYETGPR